MGIDSIKITITALLLGYAGASSLASATEQSDCFEASNNPKATIAACRSIIEKHPEDHSAIIAGVQMGKALEKLNDKKGAINAYRAAIDLHLRKFSKSLSQNSYPMEATIRIGVLLGLTEATAQEFQKLADENDARAAAMVNLIHNYSDCRKKPLELYSGIFWEYPPREKMAEVFREIRSQYPNCKLAPYMQFREAELLHENHINEHNDTDFSAALSAYEKLSLLPDKIVFPESRHAGSYNYTRTIGHQSGTPIAAIAIFRMGQLLEDKNPEKAQEKYLSVADKFPNELSVDHKNLGVLARLATLKMWLEKEKGTKPPAAVKDICNVLLQNSDTQINGISLHTQALKYLAAYQSRTGDTKNAAQTLQELLESHASGNAAYDLAIVQDLNTITLRQSNGYAKAIALCKKLIKSRLPNATKIAIQYACAEVELEREGSLLEAANEFRKIADENPKALKEHQIDGPPNLIIKAARRADSIEKFVTYVGDPPDIEQISSLQNDYKSSSDFAELLSFRQKWVLNNLGALIEIKLPSLERVLLKIGEDAVPTLIQQYIPTNPDAKTTIRRFLLIMSKSYPGITSRKLLAAYTVAPTESKPFFAPLFADIGTPAYQEALAELAEMGNKTAKIAYLKILATASTPESEIAIMKMLKDTDFEVRCTAVKILGGLKQERFIPPLIEMLKVNDGYVQMDSVEAIAKLGEVSIPYLKTAYIGSSNQSERFFIIKTLGRITTASSFELLKSGVTDQNDQIRAAAILAMYDMDPKKATPYMKDILKSTDRIDRVAQSHIKRLFEAKKINVD